MSSATAAKLREFGRQLSEAELSGLCKFAWDMDPDGKILLQILASEHVPLALDCLRLLGEDWGI